MITISIFTHLFLVLNLPEWQIIRRFWNSKRKKDTGTLKMELVIIPARKPGPRHPLSQTSFPGLPLPHRAYHHWEPQLEMILTRLGTVLT